MHLITIYFRHLYSHYLSRLGRRYLEAGKTEKAITIFEKALALVQKPEYQMNLASGLFSACRFGESIVILEKLRSDNLDTISSNLLLGQCYLLTQSYSTAIHFFQTLSEQDGKNQLYASLFKLAQDPVVRDKYRLSLYYQLQAAICSDSRSYDDAYKFLEDARELNPEDPNIHNNLGVIAFKLKKPKSRIISHFSEAMRLAPDNEIYKKHYLKLWPKIRRLKD